MSIFATRPSSLISTRRTTSPSSPERRDSAGYFGCGASRYATSEITRGAGGAATTGGCSATATVIAFGGGSSVMATSGCSMTGVVTGTNWGTGGGGVSEAGAGASTMLASIGVASKVMRTGDQLVTR